MAGTLVQFRVSETLKQQAIEVCEGIGIDLQTYLRICLFKLAKEQSIPYSLKFDDDPNDPLSRLQDQAEKAGLSNMTLDEINAEIAASRAERQAVREKSRQEKEGE